MDDNFKLSRSAAIKAIEPADNPAISANLTAIYVKTGQGMLKICIKTFPTKPNYVET